MLCLLLQHIHLVMMRAGVASVNINQHGAVNVVCVFCCCWCWCAGTALAGWGFQFTTNTGQLLSYTDGAVLVMACCVYIEPVSVVH
jgi:hypothetical protein